MWLLQGGDGLEVTGDQTMKVSSAAGDVDVCITVSSHDACMCMIACVTP